MPLSQVGNTLFFFCLGFRFVFDLCGVHVHVLVFPFLPLCFSVFGAGMSSSLLCILPAHLPLFMSSVPAFLIPAPATSPCQIIVVFALPQSLQPRQLTAPLQSASHLPHCPSPNSSMSSHENSCYANPPVFILQGDVSVIGLIAGR